jgi:hypothetical protein
MARFGNHFADCVTTGIVTVGPGIAHGKDGEAEKGRRRPAVLLYARSGTHEDEG